MRLWVRDTYHTTPQRDMPYTYHTARCGRCCRLRTAKGHDCVAGTCCKPFQTYDANFNCDKHDPGEKEKPYKKHTWMFGCRQCDFDWCQDCYSTEFPELFAKANRRFKIVRPVTSLPPSSPLHAVLPCNWLYPWRSGVAAALNMCQPFRSLPLPLMRPVCFVEECVVRVLLSIVGTSVVNCGYFRCQLCC
jgi:hypothetical protein